MIRNINNHEKVFSLQWHNTISQSAPFPILKYHSQGFCPIIDIKCYHWWYRRSKSSRWSLIVYNRISAVIHPFFTGQLGWLINIWKTVNINAITGIYSKLGAIIKFCISSGCRYNCSAEHFSLKATCNGSGSGNLNEWFYHFPWHSNPQNVCCLWRC